MDTRITLQNIFDATEPQALLWDSIVSAALSVIVANRARRGITPQNFRCRGISKTQTNDSLCEPCSIFPLA